jgi:fatty acid desaturase
MHGRRRADRKTARDVVARECFTPLGAAALWAVLVAGGHLWPALAPYATTLVFAGLVFGATCAVHLIHEAGHVIAGLFVGAPLDAATVGLVTVRRERRGGRRRFTWHLNRSWRRLAGCVEREVTPRPGMRLALTVTALGGPIASLAVGALLLAAPDPWRGLGLISLFVGVVNAVPSSFLGQASDGMLVYRLWSRRPAAVAWRMPFCGNV